MTFRLTLFAASSACFLSFVAPALAGSANDEYVANIRQHVAFLDQSSRLVADHSTDTRVIDLATAEIAEQKGVADALRMWETGRSLSTFSVAMLSGSAETMPDTVLTGRSAAVDTTIGWNHPDTGVLMAWPSVTVMPKLTTLKGDAFDDLYVDTQIASLKELAGFYDAYSKTGSDATLRAIAIRELPLVKHRIAEFEAL